MSYHKAVDHELRGKEWEEKNGGTVGGMASLPRISMGDISQQYIKILECIGHL